MKFKMLMIMSAMALSNLAKANECINGKYVLKMNPNSEFSTLNYVHNKIITDQPRCDITIAIEPGTYHGGVKWTYVNGYKIIFTANDASNKPVFDGVNDEVVNWFALQYDGHSNGNYSNIELRNIVVKNYLNGVLFSGSPYGVETESVYIDKEWVRKPVLDGNGNPKRIEITKLWNGNNIIEGMLFKNIGNKYTSAMQDKVGYGAVRFINSRHNKIQNNFFRNIENIGGAYSGSAAHMHAVYLMTHSSNNLIESNDLLGVSGNTFNTRDESNYNKFQSNVLNKTGNYTTKEWSAQMSDWYCISGRTSGKACERETLLDFKIASNGKKVVECPSHSNYFKDNSYGLLYSGEEKEQVWAVIDNKSDDYCGTLPGKRYHTSNNTWVRY